jgi:hypothetical protein
VTPRELAHTLEKTLDDGQISRAERTALRATLADSPLDEHELLEVQGYAFKLVRDRLHDSRDRELIDWLEAALKVVRPQQIAAPAKPKVYFGPDAPMVETLVSLVRGAKHTIDVAVFTITDDRLADALIEARSRGIAIRVLTDDGKVEDEGSDVARLGAAGVQVVVDDSPHHFHHKFAIFDGERLVNGSYNWTRGADRDNRENFLVTEEPRLVRAYRDQFQRLWRELAP